ncbi:MAG TPA: carbamoyltransferase [Chloroflexi bacterium]|nr:carbamoyltransferase [Chloroflexota bacterium]
MNIIGISAFYHDSSCCLLQDGKLVAAASEERFTRIKHDARLPSQAFRYCLAQAGLSPNDIDCIAYYESPVKKVGRQLAFSSQLRDKHAFSWLDHRMPLQMIHEKFGYDGQIFQYDHHLSHAASAFYYSGFKHSAIFTVDGVGEWTTTGYGNGDLDEISLFETVDFPHSLGLLYATITAFLGFRVNEGEFKVMGLASYGQPKYLSELRELIEIRSKGQYRLNLKYFDFLAGTQMFSDELADLLHLDPRTPEAEITADHQNLARSVQLLIEEILLMKTSYLKEITGKKNLVMAGGVALNAVANARIRRESGFRDIFIQPASGDAGGCLGAAALAHYQLTGKRHSTKRLSSLYLGPKYSNREIKNILRATGIEAEEFISQEDDLIDKAVDRLLTGEIIGWFQGRMEFGPRALGARSILANPLLPDIQARINKVVKKRESFRPFAPVILWPYHEQFFDLNHHVPFMIETCSVIAQNELPGITHIDGTARPQTLKEEENPRLAKLIDSFYRRSGYPILVNTSFNQRGDPIVCSPIDALFCMGNSLIDVLILEDFLITRENLPENWPQIIEDWNTENHYLKSQSSQGLDNLYSLF